MSTTNAAASLRCGEPQSWLTIGADLLPESFGNELLQLNGVQPLSLADRQQVLDLLVRSRLAIGHAVVIKLRFTMPTQVSYPGVHIEELPSGVRTITGVATSITAFLGRALRGPVNEATAITSYADFERSFGGLGYDYPMSYAVRDFYMNGGSQAVVLRLVKDDAKRARAKKDGGLELMAANEGSWGNKLRYLCDNVEVIGDKSRVFNLGIYELVGEQELPIRREYIINVSCEATSSRRVNEVLVSESQLVRAEKPRKDDQPEVKPSVPTDPETIKTESKAFADPAGVDSGNLATALYEGGEAGDGAKTGLRALDSVDLFNLLCIPPDKRDGETSPDTYSKALTYCVSRRAFLIVDPLKDWDAGGKLLPALKSKARDERDKLKITGPASRNAAVFYPRIRQPDPDRNGQLDTFVPCGVVAGVMARTDATRGVWKAPAGQDALLSGIHSLTVKLTDAENRLLNAVGINCLRSFPASGNVAWGARTLRGDDQLGDEYQYIPVRRTALFIEDCLYRGTQWAVFEPNDEPLWAHLRLNIGVFMHDMFRQGAFQGSPPRDAYFVKCDKETTTRSDINKGIVNVVVGFAPLKPAEFVIIKVAQIAVRSPCDAAQA